MMHRRALFQTAVTIGAASVLAGEVAKGQESDQEIPFIVDTNVSLFQWPFRRLPLDQTDLLVDKLRSIGVARAWAGSFEGLLHRDITGVNDRLAQTCRRYPELTPIGSINPTLPGWEQDLQTCFRHHNMPGIRLHPNYHGYALNDPPFRQLLKLAASAGRFVQLCVAMEDTRTQHPLVRVADVNLGPLLDAVGQIDQCRVQLLNYRPKAADIQSLADADGIFFDTSRIEGTDGVATMLQRIPKDRVLFGTHSPFLIPEAALIRIGESGLSQDAMRAILFESANALAS